ncbi:MAG: serine/threonine protein kinase [Clostridiales bacterium]|nr:serine/threonine protein kinase [Clostridiales bacterium]
MDDSLSVSISISKESGMEEFSRAVLEDAASRKEDVISNEQIREKDVLLETYQVLSDPISGGMGSVWKVHHKGWGTDLAMKRPQPRFFAEGSEKKKEEFIKECENWIGLGLHPNIVSCYYVREIGGVPTIFSEWMDGGSLKDCIRDGSLYEGTGEEVQERILDIAIQTARGILYSHEKGLIHQDIKPANILLTKSGEAKVADFGLSKVAGILGRGSASSAKGGASSTGADVLRVSGYTPEYCPREQAEGEKPRAWMDVYSWALTVLEMYLGERRWRLGGDVPEQLTELASNARAQIPDRIFSMLRTILSAKEDFLSFHEQSLLERYKSVTGKEYPRPEPRAEWNSPLTLNNRALSYLELGQRKKAMTILDQARNMIWFGENPARYNYLILSEEKPGSFEQKVFFDNKKNEAFALLLHMRNGDTKEAQALLDTWGENIPESVREYAPEIREALKEKSPYEAPWVLAHFQSEEEIQKERAYFREAFAKLESRVAAKDPDGAMTILREVREVASDGHLDDIARLSSMLGGIAQPAGIHAVYPINLGSTYAFKVENKDHTKRADSITGVMYRYEIRKEEKRLGPLKEVFTMEPGMHLGTGDIVYAPEEQTLDVYNRATGEQIFSIPLPGRTAYFQVLRGEKKAILVTYDEVREAADPEYTTKKRSQDFSNKKCEHDCKYRVHNLKTIACNYLMHEIDLEGGTIAPIGKGVSVMRLELDTQPKGAQRGTKTKVFHPGGYLLWRGKVKITRRYSHSGSDNSYAFKDERSGKVLLEKRIAPRRDLCFSCDGRYLMLDQELFLIDWDWEKGDPVTGEGALKICLDREDCKNFVSSNTGVAFLKEGAKKAEKKGFLFWKK